MYLKVLLLLLLLVNTISGRTIVENLPGYGDLPFTLETGYVGVGDNDDVQTFYYFVESQNDPATDPILVWITGGPTCSSLGAFFYESGPLTIDINNYEGQGLPSLIPNKYAWTKNMSMIYLDGPVGTGFSYSKSSNYTSSDQVFAARVHDFLKKWFEIEEHTQFKENGLYLGGDGYSGKIVPLAVNNIVNIPGEPSLNIKGFVVGNPGTDNNIDFQAQVDISYYMALIPRSLYDSAYKNCDGNFTAPSPNALCTTDTNAILELKQNLDPLNILAPLCANGVPTTAVEDSARRSLGENSRLSILQADSATYKQCSSYIHNVTEIWANNPDVRTALNIAENTVKAWIYCNSTLSNSDTYNKSVTSVISYHQDFVESTNLQALIYSGDHDISIPHIATEQWIAGLTDLSEVYAWRPWLVDGETAGYTMRFSNNLQYNLTYVTVKAGGHFTAQDKVKECSQMVKNWMANISLDEPVLAN